MPFDAPITPDSAEATAAAYRRAQKAQIFDVVAGDRVGSLAIKFAAGTTKAQADAILDAINAIPRVAGVVAVGLHIVPDIGTGYEYKFAVSSIVRPTKPPAVPAPPAG